MYLLFIYHYYEIRLTKDTLRAKKQYLQENLDIIMDVPSVIYNKRNVWE
jgi:hypothetical protein